MAQLDFYLSKEDKLEFVDFLFSREVMLIPSINYPSKKYIELRSLKDYEEHVDKNSLMHIIHPSFTKEKLELDFFEKEGKKLFYIVQRHGGPTIDFYSPGKIVENRVNLIGPGFIGIYPYNWKGKEKQPASDSLKSFYKDISNFIKKHSVPLKNSKRTYRIGKAATHAIHQGYKLVNVSNEVLKSSLSE